NSKGGSLVRVDTTPDGNGLQDWNPASSGELFDQGKATIANAMAKARAQFPNDHVVFGGVLWWQGNDLGSTHPDGFFDGTWEDVRQAYADLLYHFGEDVANNPAHAGYGGRFYFMNSPVKRDEDHSYSDEAYGPVFDYGFDLEAD